MKTVLLFLIIGASVCFMVVIIANFAYECCIKQMYGEKEDEKSQNAEGESHDGKNETKELDGDESNSRDSQGFDNQSSLVNG